MIAAFVDGAAAAEVRRHFVGLGYTVRRRRGGSQGIVLMLFEKERSTHRLLVDVQAFRNHEIDIAELLSRVEAFVKDETGRLS